MRHDHNALKTVEQVKQRLDELRRGLPEGVEVVVTYDRSGLIGRAVHNLRDKLIEESLVVALVCLLFLFHVRSSLVVRSEEHTSELQSLMRISYAVFCLKKTKLQMIVIY